MQIISIAEEKKMYNTAEDVHGLVERIKKSAETLKGIDLSENSFSPDALEAVLIELSKIEEMEIVIFKGIFTQRVKEQVYPSLQSIVKYLTPLKKIAYFDISDNALSLHGMEILSPMIEKMHLLKHLVMNNNGIGIDGGEFLSQALENLSKESKVLESLEVGRNRLEESATKLGKALSLFPCFDALKIYQNSINSINTGNLLTSLSTLNMRILDISDNFLLEYGSTVLSQAMKSWPIEYLNIADCMMSDKGVEVLANALPEHIYIQGELVSEKEIDMSYNDITDESLDSIRAIIKKICHTKFILTGNEIGKDEISQIKKEAEMTTCEIEFEEEDDELVFSSEEKEKTASDEEIIRKLEEQISEIVIQKE
ncbi:Ran GTPase-activating protein 1 [Nematocida sp. AWRm78]|nr:Ran GTPase-activating protein 1 [Nematocida sp. AWRm79]KAI5182405.1 Ran GTPase-activating protein 1 [Nematocida sp. AWRm78]